MGNPYFLIDDCVWDSKFNIYLKWSLTKIFWMIKVRYPNSRIEDFSRNAIFLRANHLKLGLQSQRNLKLIVELSNF